MDKVKAINYLENSFLISLLNDKDITDISYNGEDIYYVSNAFGRKKSDIVIEPQMAKDFVRQMANISEKQFSFTSPNLDISVGRYRLNATHQSICKVRDEGAISFALRIASGEARLTSGDDFFGHPAVEELLQLLVINRQSLVIGGVTSSGKTELQKYLIRSMPKNERVLVIDNVLELEAVRKEDLDLTCWQVDEENKEASAAKLIRNALRNNPDWLILAEARGEEMVDVLNASMTGLSVITTIHAFDAEALTYRMGRMVMQSRQKNVYEEVLNDIYYHFHFYIYLRKEEGQDIKRYISEIIYRSNDGKKHVLYERDGNKKIFYPLDKEMNKFLRKGERSLDFKKAFGERNEK